MEAQQRWRRCIGREAAVARGCHGRVYTGARDGLGCGKQADLEWGVSSDVCVARTSAPSDFFLKSG